VVRITGRSALTTAMTYQTLDHLSGGGRVIAGLGAGGRLLAEGIDGVRWGKPAVQMRDYVAILRQALSGQLADHHGKEISVPYRGPDAYRDVDGNSTPPVRSGLEPLAPIPIMLGAGFPRTITQAAEIADGWMPPTFTPKMLAQFKPYLEEGFARAGNGKGFGNFKIWAHVDVNVDNDVKTAMHPFKEYVVIWSQRQRAFMEARGYKSVTDRLRELLAPDDAYITSDAFSARAEAAKWKGGALWDEALAAVPDEYIDEGNWLAGPLERIRARVRPWLECGLTGLIVRYGDQFTHDPVGENLEAFRIVAEAAGKAPRR
jgi:alkanesulfonate monooxygenase SsuD/methylene tetrahydromethanopterin reductase-like flavin-dependent oxidoreductase (luciferase family)